MKQTKGDWTAEEIEQAGKLYKELCIELMNKGYLPVFLAEEKKKAMHLYAFDDTFRGAATGNDVFNELIGDCVCLCKATGHEVPDWIQNKNR